MAKETTTWTGIRAGLPGHEVKVERVATSRFTVSCSCGGEVDSGLDRFSFEENARKAGLNHLADMVAKASADAEAVQAGVLKVPAEVRASVLGGLVMPSGIAWEPGDRAVAPPRLEPSPDEITFESAMESWDHHGQIHHLRVGLDGRWELQPVYCSSAHCYGPSGLKSRVQRLLLETGYRLPAGSRWRIYSDHWAASGIYLKKVEGRGLSSVVEGS